MEQIKSHFQRAAEGVKALRQNNGVPIPTKPPRLEEKRIKRSGKPMAMLPTPPATPLSQRDRSARSISLDPDLVIPIIELEAPAKIHVVGSPSKPLRSTVNHCSVDADQLSSLSTTTLVKRLLETVQGNASHLEIVIGEAVDAHGQPLVHAVQEIALLIDVQHERQKQLVQAALQAFLEKPSVEVEVVSRPQPARKETGQSAGVPFIDLGDTESASGDEPCLEDHDPVFGYGPDVEDYDSSSDFQPDTVDGSRPSSSGSTSLYMTPPATPSAPSAHLDPSSATPLSNLPHPPHSLSPTATAYMKRRVGSRELNRLYNCKNGLSESDYKKDDPGHITASPAKRVTRQARLAADAKLSKYGEYRKLSKKERDAMWFHVEDEEVGHNANASYDGRTNKRKADVDNGDDAWMPEKKQRNA